MRQSQLFAKTLKRPPKDEVSRNAQLLVRGGFADKLMAGVYTILPLGFRVLKKIEGIIREEMDAIGGQEFLMSTLHPKANWEVTGRWASLDSEMYKIKDGDREYAVAPTHEEVIVPLFKKYISSRKDLPLAAYQIQNKFRKEKRAKSGLLRGREFIMKDLYSFHVSEEDLDQYYEKVEKAYENIFTRAGIGEKTYKTFASGGTFSKYSHEYQTITGAGEDTIYVCHECRLAVNKEIISDVESRCPECRKKLKKKEKSIEVGNIFKLGTKYSQPFNLSITDEKERKRDIVMGCYGIGLQRLMGTIVEVSNDERGIIWPESAAPFQVHLLSLGKNREAEKIFNDLVKKNIEVLFDDRDASPGEKFADADLIGIPWRAVVSEKSIKKGGIEIKKRDSKKIEVGRIDKLAEKIKRD